MKRTATMTSDQAASAAKQAVIAAPSVGAISTWWLGIPIEQATAVLGFCVLLMQLCYGIWKWWTEREEKKRRREREGE
jgi:apolipoprotein N-acyltransferase